MFQIHFNIYQTGYKENKNPRDIEYPSVYFKQAATKYRIKNGPDMFYREANGYFEICIYNRLLLNILYVINQKYGLNL
ncbi:hypothetical protein B5F34_07750 [Mediterranea sp. An20]|nr:hypothetical protein B5F34_07750 [Mediterranea sp. An20]